MEATLKPVPIMHPCYEVNLPWTIGRFYVLTIRASLSDSLTWPNTYEDMAIAYVAIKNEAECNTPTPLSGA